MGFVLALSLFNNNALAQGSDTIESLGGRYRSQAVRQTNQIDQYLTLAETSSSELFDIAYSTENANELTSIVEVLLMRGLAGTTIWKPYLIGRIQSLDEEEVRYEYKRWLSSEDNISYTEEAEGLFSELATLLNGARKWNLLKSSSQFSELIQLLVATPNFAIYRVLSAWNAKSLQPTFLARSLHHMFSFLVMGLFAAEMPLQPSATIPVWLRSVRTGRPMQLFLRDTSIGYRHLMREDLSASQWNGAGVSDYFALEKLPEGVTTKESFRFKDLKILVVDDEALELAAFKFPLKGRYRAGCVDTAPNGEVAVKMASTKKYDVILMDLDMPVQNGMEAIQKIRAGTMNHNTPAICTSRNAEPGLSIKLHQAGFNAHFRKSVTDVGRLEEFMNFWTDHGLIPPLSPVP